MDCSLGKSSSSIDELNHSQTQQKIHAQIHTNQIWQIEDEEDLKTQTNQSMKLVNENDGAL